MNEDLTTYIEPETEARIVALVLGEASPFEREELERLLKRQPELQFFKERIEEIHGLVGEAIRPAHQEQWRLSDQRRVETLSQIQKKSSVVQARAPRVSQRSGLHKRLGVYGLVACLMVMAVGLFTFSLMQKNREKSGLLVLESASEKNQQVSELEGFRAPEQKPQDSPPTGLNKDHLDGQDLGIAQHDFEDGFGVDPLSEPERGFAFLEKKEKGLAPGGPPNSPALRFPSDSGGQLGSELAKSTSLDGLRSTTATRAQTTTSAEEENLRGREQWRMAGSVEQARADLKALDSADLSVSQFDISEQPDDSVLSIRGKTQSVQLEPQSASDQTIAASNFKKALGDEREVSKQKIVAPVSGLTPSDSAMKFGKISLNEDEEAETSKVSVSGGAEHFFAEQDESRPSSSTLFKSSNKNGLSEDQSLGDQDVDGFTSKLGVNDFGDNDPFAMPTEKEGRSQGGEEAQSGPQGSSFFLGGGITADELTRSNSDFISPVDAEKIPGIPTSSNQAVAEIVTAAAGSGVAAVDSLEIEKFLDEPAGAVEFSGVARANKREGEGQMQSGISQSLSEVRTMPMTVDGGQSEKADRYYFQDPSHQKAKQEPQSEGLQAALGVDQQEGKSLSKARALLEEVGSEMMEFGEGGSSDVIGERAQKEQQLRFGWGLNGALNEPGEIEAKNRSWFGATKPQGEPRATVSRQLAQGASNSVLQEALEQRMFAQKDKELPKRIGEAFETVVARKSDSTFSLNVSDVSFKLAESSLQKGQWPESSQIRPEEFVNALNYSDRVPTQLEKVACQIEQGSHPFMQQRNLLRISMTTAALGRSASTPLCLTVLLDQSGSMERRDRAESVRRAFELLCAQLRAHDLITLVGFSRQPRLLAHKVQGDQSHELMKYLENPITEGGTNLEQALSLGLDLARQQFLEGAQNRIILLTDGAANLGDALPRNLAKHVIDMRNAQIAFDACGVGADGFNDDILTALTRQGDGRYYFLDRPEDADEGFARQIAGSLRPAAQNVKVQVIFNPERVSRFKLYGFEKHQLAKKDFRNDSVDAAEMAAEESGVALYHFESLPQGRGDIGSVSVRFLDPSTRQMIERTWTIPYESQVDFFSQSSPSLRLAGIAGLFAEKLTASPVGERVELKTLRQELQRLKPLYQNQPRFSSLENMLEQASQ